jgi:hypothetical protein
LLLVAPPRATIREVSKDPSAILSESGRPGRTTTFGSPLSNSLPFAANEPETTAEFFGATVCIFGCVASAFRGESFTPSDGVAGACVPAALELGATRVFAEFAPVFVAMPPNTPKR